MSSLLSDDSRYFIHEAPDRVSMSRRGITIMGKKHKSQKKYQPVIPVLPTVAEKMNAVTGTVTITPRPNPQIDTSGWSIVSPKYPEVTLNLGSIQFSKDVMDAAFNGIYVQGSWAPETPEQKALRAEREAERERERLAQEAKNKLVDDRLANADEPFRSIAAIHERDDTWPGCFTCDEYEDKVPVEFRCKTIKLIVDHLIRNEAIVAHRETVSASVLEVGAL